MRACATTLASELSAEELEFLTSFVRRSRFRDRCLEIGTAAGGTLCELIKSFVPEIHPRFVVVDPMTYFPQQLALVKDNLRQHNLDPELVDFRVSKSYPAFLAAHDKAETFDFMLIDGSHKIRYVTEDLSWTRLLNVQGIVCFHDYTSRFKGVTWSIDRFLRKHPNYQREALVGSLLVVRKTEPSRRPEISDWDRLWAKCLAPLLQLEQSIRKRWPG